MIAYVIKLKFSDKRSLFWGFAACVITFFALLGHRYSDSAELNQQGDAGSVHVELQCPQWNPSAILGPVDGVFASLACTRHHLTGSYPDAGSTVDSDVSFSSASDVLAYIPRALQVGLLSPFPNMWLEQASSPAGGLMRLVAAVEMVFFYMALGGVVVFLMMKSPVSASHLKQSKLIVVLLLLFSLCWVLVYALATSNVGSLYRVRLPIMALLMGLGAVGWARFFERLRQ